MELIQLLSLTISVSVVCIQPWLSVDALVEEQARLLNANPNAPSSKGNEFFIGFIGNTRNADEATQPPAAALFVTTDDDSPVSFTVEYFSTSQSGTAVKGQTTLVRLPIGGTNEPGDVRVRSESERNKGIRVKAEGDKLLTIYGINDAHVSTDAFLALPYQQFPNVEYRYFVFSADVAGTSVAFESRFLIVGNEDDTRVTVIPTRTIEIPTDLTGAAVVQIVDPTSSLTSVNRGSFNLDRLETIQFSSSHDLTGTIIESTKPISLFVGHECGQIPSDQTACDHLVEQIPPDATWGTQFFTVPLHIRESGERFRVGTVTNDNVVTVTCTTEGQMPRLLVTSTTIHADRALKQYVEFDTVGDTTNGVTESYKRDFCCIETSKPAIVMMYSKGHSVDEITLSGITGTQGDPFMVLIPPLDQYSNNYTVTSAKQVRTEFVGRISYALPIQFFNNSAIDRAAFTINGTQFTPDSGYQAIYCANGQICGYGAYSGLPVGDGDHLVAYTMPGSALNLYVYGFLREISFAYPAGFEMEAIGVPRITIFDITVLESVGTVRIPINRTAGDLSRNSVIRANSRDGTAVAGSDYQSKSNFRIRWLSNQVDPRYVPNGTRQDPVFEFTIINDDTPEDPREYFEIVLTLNPGGNGRNGFFFPDAIGRVTILDDDIPPSIGFDPESYMYEEDDGEAVLTVTTSDPTEFTDATGALFYTDDGSAVGSGAERDFIGTSRANAVPIIFEAGQTSTTVRVPIVNDRRVERTEQFFGRIVSGGGIPDINIFAPNATVNITDNDRLIFGFEELRYNFTESVGTGFVGVRLSPESGELTENLVFSFTTMDDSATSPEDYTQSSAVEYTFTPGVMSLDIPVVIVDDDMFEQIESFRAELTTSRPGVIIDVPMTTVDIWDNDLIGIGFDPVMYTYDEDEGIANLTIRKFSNPPGLVQNVTVIFFTTDSTAQAGSDYTARSAVEVTFAPDETTKTVEVMITDDTTVENLERFFGNLMISPDSADIAEVTVPQATVNIEDNDQRIQVGFDPANYTVTEGGVATLRIVLDMPYTEDITVNLQTADATARALDDYTAVTMTVTFPAGVTVQTVNVYTIDDSVAESPESFIAMLSNPTPSEVVMINQQTATVNIADNEAVTIGFSSQTYSVNECDGQVSVTIEVSGSLQREVVVYLSTNNQTTYAGVNYEGLISQPLTFDSINKAITVNVSIFINTNETSHERDEDFTVTISFLEETIPRVLLEPDSANVTIFEADGQVGFILPEVREQESVGVVNFTVGLISGKLCGQMKFNFSVDNTSSATGVSMEQE